MDINKYINNIKNSKPFQYVLATMVFGIIVYSGFSAFHQDNKTSVPKDTAQNAIVPIAKKQDDSEKNSNFKNQKRVLQNMQINYKKSINPNDVYIGSQSSQDSETGLIGGYKLKIENKIYQIKDLNKTKVKKKAEKKAETQKKPKLLSLNTDKTQNNKSNLTLDIPSSEPDKKKDLSDKIELYSEIYNYSHPIRNNGKLVVKKAFWNNSQNKKQSKDNEKNINIINQQNNNNSSNNTPIVKIVPGSTFFARLMIPIENIYSNEVKPIAKIVSGPLKGYKIIGQIKTDNANNGLILTFTRLISPEGSEYSVKAIGVQTKNLSPKFVDSINRNLLPRITFATLATVADTLFNGNNKNYTAPAQSILSQQLQQMIREYPTEIKVNPKYFVVIFY